MKILLIQNCKTESFGYIENYLIENQMDYAIFHAYNDIPFPDSRNIDAVIVGGTPLSACKIHEHSFLMKEWDFLREILDRGKAYFGVCFGAQILARLLGAEVRKNSVMEIGCYQTKLTKHGKSSRFFNNFPEVFPVFHWHGDTFDIPENADLLVTGIDCKNQAFSLGNALGVQFHLEVSPEEAEKWAGMYSGELKFVNKTKQQVVSECQEKEIEMKKLMYQLMDNFLGK